MLNNLPVYLLIEESARELRSRILIGLHAIARGHPVIIGHQWWFLSNFDKLPIGIVVFKGNNKIQTSYMRMARNNGHYIFSLDEEIFGLTNPGLSDVFSDDSAELCDTFLVQGLHHKEYLLNKFPRSRERIVIVGNPRSDLLRRPFRHRLASRTTEIHAKYGRFILVNSNHAVSNPRDYDGINFMERSSHAGTYDFNQESGRQHFLGALEWDRNNLRAMTRLMAELRRRVPDVPIVVRPHPSEWFGRWECAYGQVDGIHIVRDPDFVSWITASELLLHSSCTTGFEAFLLDARALSLATGDRTRNHSHLSNHANPSVRSVDEAAGIVERLLRYGDDSPWSQTDFHARLAPYQRIEPGRLSSAILVDALHEFSLRHAGKVAPSRKTLLGPFVDVPMTERQNEKMCSSNATITNSWRDIVEDVGVHVFARATELGTSVVAFLPEAA